MGCVAKLSLPNPPTPRSTSAKPSNARLSHSSLTRLASGTLSPIWLKSPNTPAFSVRSTSKPSGTILKRTGSSPRLPTSPALQANFAPNSTNRNWNWPSAALRSQDTNSLTYTTIPAKARPTSDCSTLSGIPRDSPHPPLSAKPALPSSLYCDFPNESTPRTKLFRPNLNSSISWKNRSPTYLPNGKSKHQMER